LAFYNPPYFDFLGGSGREDAGLAKKENFRNNSCLVKLMFPTPKAVSTSGLKKIKFRTDLKLLWFDFGGNSEFRQHIDECIQIV
jgi:hypothetical protein